MIGETLGKYRIIEPLGVGGMGEVYLAQDTSLKRQVAIKLLPQALSRDPERLARLEREAQLLAALNHPNIASIHNLERSGDRLFLVLELVEGETLAEHLDRGALPLELALEVARQIAQALEAAHEAGIIHRDLKPANIKITPDFKVKVLDFGLAKATGPEPGDPNSDLSHSPTLVAGATRTGMILGTAAYMSPEQARGHVLDKRTDIWSFGLVLYEMLSGDSPFAGDTLSDTMAGILKEDPDWTSLPDGTPAQVRRLLLRCTRKDRGKRLRDIGDAHIEIEEAIAEPEGMGGIGAPAPTAMGLDRLVPLKSGLPILALSVAAATLAGWALTRVQPRTPQPSIHVETRFSDEYVHFGFGSQVALSPDGTHIVYGVGDPGYTELHVRSIDQLQSTWLADGVTPFFSPDGRWVGFGSPIVNEMQKIPLAGGTPQRIVVFDPITTTSDVGYPTGASWGADETIVFGIAGRGLFRVHDDGGDPVELTTLGPGEFAHRWPQVLPGAEAVLFTSSNEGDDYNARNIEILDLATGRRKVVHRGGSYARYVPTGHLVYANQGNLVAMPFDLDRLEPSGPAAVVVTGLAVGGNGAQYSFDETGTLVYLKAVDLDLLPDKVLWVDREGNTTDLLDEPGIYSDPALSPDGNRLALTVLDDDRNADIWVYDLERQTRTRVVAHEASDHKPLWSPDGNYLAFTSMRNGGAYGLFMTRADGSGEPELLMDGGARWANSWSADGRFIAYSEFFDMDTTGGIGVLALEGDREPELVLNTRAQEQYPAFSPNGRWLAYVSNESGQREVFVRSYPPSQGQWLVASPGTLPRWSADGHELFYRTDTGIMVVAVDTASESFDYQQPRPLFQGPFRGGLEDDFSPDYAVSGDGQSFVMFPERTDTSGNVVLITNWFEELKRLAPIQQ